MEDDKAKKALIGAARTIARSADLASGQFPDLHELDATIHSQGTTPPQVSDASAALDEAGPRYQRLDLLGEGGMGQVWQVRDERVGRRVAMKLVRGETADDGSRARFLREARVQGQLEHPAVVPVYDLGRSPDGELFFTMKRVRGVTLSDVIMRLAAKDREAQERYSTRRLLTAFSQVCLALEYAHARGVLHRDLKPDNLMLGDHGEVYVLDWGVARVLRDDLVADDTASLPPEALRALAAAGNQTGLVGTPGYIAPEQLRGKPIGPPADVYALGAILFELLTLRPLNGAATVLGRLERALAGIDTAAELGQRDHGLSPELVALCVRATATDPAARLPSARAMHDAIEAYLDGERDLQLRRDLADRHLAAARAAIAGGGDELEAHKRALRETGRALGVMPDHPEARRMILELFAQTPKASPPEVQDEIDRERARQTRLTAKGGAWGMASMLLFVPIMALIGVRDWAGIAVFSGLTVVAVAASAQVAQQDRPSRAAVYLLVLFNNVVFSLCAGLYGPLVMVPTMVITNTVTFALHLDGSVRLWTVLSGCLAVLVPLALPLLGLVPSSYVAEGGNILLRPLWLALPPGPTVAIVAVGTVIAIMNGVRAVAAVRDALTAAERRNQMQRWQLQQLLPEAPEPGRDG